MIRIEELNKLLPKDFQEIFKIFDRIVHDLKNALLWTNTWLSNVKAALGSRIQEFRADAYHIVYFKALREIHYLNVWKVQIL